MFEFVVWVFDGMGRHFEEETFLSLEEAVARGEELAEDMCSEEGWYIERKVDGAFDCYMDF